VHRQHSAEKYGTEQCWRSRLREHCLGKLSRFLFPANESRELAAQTVEGHPALVLGRTAWLAALGLVLLAPPAHARGEEDGEEAPRASGRSPWVAASGSGFFLGNRALVPLALGPELGGYLIGRVRLAGRLAVPVLRGDDWCAGADVIYADQEGVFTCLPSRSPSLSYGASLGFVVLDSEHWLLAPGITTLNTNVSDHGVMLGGSLPVDWVSAAGWRFGLELGLGAALGQTVRGRCRNHVVAPCSIGAVRHLPNGRTRSAFLGLSVGWSLRADRR
jgi:hypothetical protein